MTDEATSEKHELDRRIKNLEWDIKNRKEIEKRQVEEKFEKERTKNLRKEYRFQGRVEGVLGTLVVIAVISVCAMLISAIATSSAVSTVHELIGK
jgi:hypothetical protein